VSSYEYEARENTKGECAGSGEVDTGWIEEQGVSATTMARWVETCERTHAMFKNI